MAALPPPESAAGPPPRCRWIARWLVVVGTAGGIGLLLWRLQPQSTPQSPPEPSLATPVVPDTLGPARRRIQAGDFEGALNLTDRLITTQPDDVDLLLLHAEALFRLYRTDEMIPWLQHALTLQPERFEVHANLAFALRFAGRLEEAEREAQWCLARQPGHAAVRRVLAEIHRDRGNYDAALDEVRKALRTAPHDLDSRLLEADLLLFARDFEAAFQGLGPLREEYGHNRRYLSTLVRAAQMTGRTADAEACRAALQRLDESR